MRPLRKYVGREALADRRKSAYGVTVMSESKNNNKTLSKQVGTLVLTDVLLPLMMIIVVIMILVVGVNYVFYNYNADNAEEAVLRLSESNVKTKEEIQSDYPDYIVVYYNYNKRLITEEGYGNNDFAGIAYALPSSYYGLVRSEIGGKEYLAATHTMDTPQNEAAYVRVYVDLTTSNSMKNSILGICSAMICFAFVVQSFLGIFAVKTQTKPLQKSLDRNARLISDISHEFNTPLAIINTNISTALANPDKKVEDVSDALVNAVKETQRLKRMIKEMLVLSSSDSRKTILNIENTDISELTREVVEPFAIMCEMDEKEFEDGITDGIWINTDKDKYRQILIALLDNALKYTVEGEKVGVYLKRSENKVLLSVKDTGKGVDEADIKKIFDRFYRSDESRNGKTGGSGLGLAIVKEITRSLGGKIYVRNNVPHGFVVEVEFMVKQKK